MEFRKKMYPIYKGKVKTIQQCLVHFQIKTQLNINKNKKFKS